MPGNLKQTKWKKSAPYANQSNGDRRWLILRLDHTGDVNKIPVYTYVFPGENKSGWFWRAMRWLRRYWLIIWIRWAPNAYEKLANVNQSKTIFGGMENAKLHFFILKTHVGR